MFEDHWIKPEKLNVERANGMTIYFPTEGVKYGYSNLEIMENTWFNFISNYETAIQSESNFENVAFYESERSSVFFCRITFLRLLKRKMLSNWQKTTIVECQESLETCLLDIFELAMKKFFL